jgi:hypothetical protein
VSYSPELKAVITSYTHLQGLERKLGLPIYIYILKRANINGYKLVIEEAQCHIVLISPILIL